MIAKAEALQKKLIVHLRDIVPMDPEARWSFHLDLSNSCFLIENANVISGTLRGNGGPDLEKLDMDVCVRVTIGQSYHLQLVKVKKNGVSEAIQSFLQLPKEIVVCRECGHLRVGTGSECKKCLFLQLYATCNQMGDTCSICQDWCFRTVLPCGHFFHTTCLLNMDPHNAKCPNCRTPLTDVFIKQLFGEYDLDSESEEESDYEEE